MTETPADDEDRTPEQPAEEATEAPAAGEAGQAPPAAASAPDIDATTDADTGHAEAVGAPKVEPHDAAAASAPGETIERPNDAPPAETEPKASPSGRRCGHWSLSRSGRLLRCAL